MEQRIDLDETLGIVGVDIAIAGRSGTASDVPERTKAIAHRARLLARERWRCRVESSERVAQHVDAIDARRGDVVLFRRIRGERVELLNRQIDVLLTAEDDAAERGPSSGEVRGH